MEQYSNIETAGYKIFDQYVKLFNTKPNKSLYSIIYIKSTYNCKKIHGLRI